MMIIFLVAVLATVPTIKEELKAGFLVKVINAYDSTQPLGVVLAMAPNAGTTQTIGSQVTITINKQG